MIKKQKWLLQLTAVIFVTVMVLAAEGLGEREILFPEIAALAVGALAAPRQSWQTNRVWMVASIAVCATGGVLIVRLVPWPLWGQMLLAFAICQGMYLFSRTTFAPMISAMVLPVLLGTTSWVYPIAAVVLTAGIAGLQFLFEKVGIREKLPFSPLPLPGRQDILDTLLRILCAGAVIFAAVLTGWRMCAAPPLLVAFTEFSRCGSRARSTPLPHHIFGEPVRVLRCTLPVACFGGSRTSAGPCGRRSHVRHPAADVEDEAVSSSGWGHGYPADASAGGAGEVIRHSGVHRRFDIYGIGAAALSQQTRICYHDMNSLRPGMRQTRTWTLFFLSDGAACLFSACLVT